MSEKCELETILTLTKSLINIDINGTVEASNKQTRKTFEDILNTNLGMQMDIYNQMTEDGYYTINNVSNSEIAKLYAKLKKDEK